MSDVTDASAPPETGEGEPAPEADQVEALSPETSDTEAFGEGTETEAEGEEAEELEFDFGGDKLRVKKGEIPEEVAQRLDQFTKGLWSKFTRENQSLAETRKQVEAAQAAVAKLSTLSEEGLAIYSEGMQVSRELEQLRAINLDALWQSDPDQARRVSDAISRKSAEYERVMARAQEHGTKRTQAEAAEIARREEEGRKRVAQRIKGFNEKVEAEVIEYATKTYGMAPEIAKRWPENPDGFDMAWKAMQWDRMQAQAARAVAKPPAPAAAPVAPIKGRSAPAAKSPDQMSDDEWVRWRNQQLAKRRA